MKVRATALGYYGHERRREGDVFVLEPIKRIRKDKDGKAREVTIMPEQQFSERWMEKVDQKAEKPKKEKPVIPAPEPKVETTEGI